MGCLREAGRPHEEQGRGLAGAGRASMVCPTSGKWSPIRTILPLLGLSYACASTSTDQLADAVNARCTDVNSRAGRGSAGKTREGAE